MTVVLKKGLARGRAVLPAVMLGAAMLGVFAGAPPVDASVCSESKDAENRLDALEYKEQDLQGEIQDLELEVQNRKVQVAAEPPPSPKLVAARKRVADLKSLISALEVETERFEREIQAKEGALPAVDAELRLLESELEKTLDELGTLLYEQRDAQADAGKAPERNAIAARVGSATGASLEKHREARTTDFVGDPGSELNELIADVKALDHVIQQIAIKDSDSERIKKFGQRGDIENRGHRKDAIRAIASLRSDVRARLARIDNLPDEAEQDVKVRLTDDQLKRIAELEKAKRIQTTAVQQKTQEVDGLKASIRSLKERVRSNRSALGEKPKELQEEQAKVQRLESSQGSSGQSKLDEAERKLALAKAAQATALRQIPILREHFATKEAAMSALKAAFRDRVQAGRDIARSRNKTVKGASRADVNATCLSALAQARQYFQSAVAIADANQPCIDASEANKARELAARTERTRCGGRGGEKLDPEENGDGMVRVPPLVGLPYPTAAAILRALGLIPTPSWRKPANLEEAGKVSEQIPGADEPVAPKSIVTLVAKNPPTVVPPLMGRPWGEAYGALIASGLSPNATDDKPPPPPCDKSAVGKVYHHTHTPGQLELIGETVSIWYYEPCPTETTKKDVPGADSLDPTGTGKATATGAADAAQSGGLQEKAGDIGDTVAGDDDDEDRSSDVDPETGSTFGDWPGAIATRHSSSSSSVPGAEAGGAGTRGASGAGASATGAAAEAGRQTGDATPPSADEQIYIAARAAAVRAYANCDFTGASSIVHRHWGDPRMRKLVPLIDHQLSVKARLRQALAERSSSLANDALAAADPALTPPCLMGQLQRWADRMAADKTAKELLPDQERRQREIDEATDIFTNTMLGVLGAYADSRSKPSQPPRTGDPPPRQPGDAESVRDCIIQTAPTPGSLGHYVGIYQSGAGPTQYSLVPFRDRSREKTLAAIQSTPGYKGFLGPFTSKEQALAAARRRCPNG